MARIPERLMRHRSGSAAAGSRGCPNRLSRNSMRTAFWFAPLLLLVLAGCTTGPPQTWYGTLPPGATFIPGENPIFVPEVDREFLWNQLVAAIDDDFRIERENRMQVIGGVITEGMIETFPTTGSSLLEPWRGDSSGWFQRSYATLQSIRRRATARVTPVPGGYSVALVVTVELEDLGRPELATTGSIHLQHDSSIRPEQAGKFTGPGTIGWIPMGRDNELEGKILADIRERVGYTAPAVAPAIPGMAPGEVAPGYPGAVPGAVAPAVPGTVPGAAPPRL